MNCENKFATKTVAKSIVKKNLQQLSFCVEGLILYSGVVN